MIQHYLKIAWRSLLKYKPQTVIGVLGLAIGFTAFIFAAYWYHWEHSFDTFHPDWENTYAVTTTGLLENRGAGYADLNQLHQDAKNVFTSFPEIETYCITEDVKYTTKDKERAWIGMTVESAFFDMFSCELLEGTYKGNAYDNKSVILTQSMAEYLFGEKQCVGEIYKVNDNTSLVVVGIMKDYPDNSHFKFNYLLLGKPEYGTFTKRLPTYVRLKANVNKKNLQEKISAYTIPQEDTKFHKYSQWKFNLCSLPDIHLTCSPELDTRFQNIQILLVGGLLAFVSALMNLLVLFISRQRLKVRYNPLYKVIGASTKGIILRGMTELTLFLIIPFLVSMTIIELIFPIYRQYTQLENYGIFQDFIQYLSKNDLMTMAMSTYWLVGLVFLLMSILPIYVLMKNKKNNVSVAFRDALIAGQIFIGALFLITGLAFYSQYRYTQKTDKGINTENIWQINLGFDAVWVKDNTPYVELLRQSPYIEDVTTMTNSVFSSLRQYYCSYVTRLPLHGRDDNFSDANIVIVEPNFLSFFGMKMQQGVWLSDNAIPEYVINETGAKEVNLNTDFNKIYDIPDAGGNQFRISGILKDYHYFPMQYPLEKTFFHIPSQKEKDNLLLRTQFIYIKVKPEYREKALSFAHEHYKDFSKDEIAPDKQILQLTDLLQELNAPDINMSRIFLLLAAICIFISASGIYSLVALSTEQRRKEIAIRKINGAKFYDILNLFLKRYLALTIVANMVALPLGFLFINRWLETYAYHFKLTFGLFAIVVIITISIVIFSVTRQIGKTIKMSETDVLKSE
ncbi:MAG: ABC transporter permease [Proteiniphilum sp.]|nr:ABC transporter permease [Proteiniphilum sp.]MDD4415356.1 ABC transporter permease [Proteiniphilum sp.]